MRPKKVKETINQELEDGEHIVITPSSDKALVLNPTGNAVLLLCDGSYTSDDIVGLISDQFNDIPRERICNDVVAVLTELKQAGIIEDMEE